ncbi:hypothetical protein LSAT2_008289 [Lamellibrachia satsuma]|nr:hypothetical protein LSAT2_008289 [Lamellibrachia satsuma]
MNIYLIVILLMMASLVREGFGSQDDTALYKKCLEYCWSIYSKCMRRSCPYTDLSYRERIVKCWKDLQVCDKRCSKLLISD